MTYGAILKALRKEKKLTQEELGNLLGITYSAYGKYEQEKAKPNSDTLNKLAEFYDVTTDYILGNKNKSPVELPTKQDMVYVNSASIVLASAGNGINNGDGVFYDDEKTQILKEWLRGTSAEKAFYATVKGDSMKDANIIDGSKLLFIKVEEVLDGQIGLFTVNDEQFLKRYREYGTTKVLQSANKDYDDIILNEDDSVSFDGLLVIETIEFNK